MEAGLDNQCIKRRDITELKALANPPVLVQLILEMTFYMLDDIKEIDLSIKQSS